MVITDKVSILLSMSFNMFTRYIFGTFIYVLVIVLVIVQAPATVM